VSRLVAVTFLACAVWAQAVAAQAIQVRPDSRIELLSIVFHLAGASEYNQGQVPSYVRDVDKWFGPFRDYPVVRRARLLKDSAGIGYSDPMEFALHLTNANDLGELVPIDAPDQGPEWAWRPADARAFLGDLRTFARDAQTDRFFRSHERLFATAAARLRHLVDSAGDPAWFSHFFGHAPVKPFALVPALLNGGANYGPRIRTPDGEEFYAIAGVYLTDRDGLPCFDEQELPAIVHEFSHSFINPIIARHLGQFEGAGSQILAAEAQQMKDQAYETWSAVIDESLVRATVVRYRLSHEGHEAAEGEIDEQKARGFLWIRELSDLLGQYETARRQYPDFEAFLPRMADYFGSLPAHLPALAAQYDSLRPRVVRMSPANGASGVDASLRRIRIWFDRPMADGMMMVNPVQDDSGVGFPEITGKGTFDEDRTLFTLPVRLEPGRSYALALGALLDHGFRSEAGVPLARVVVRFRTEEAH
jgi:hypothetical protein